MSFELKVLKTICQHFKSVESPLTVWKYCILKLQIDNFLLGVFTRLVVVYLKTLPLPAPLNIGLSLHTNS